MNAVEFGEELRKLREEEGLTATDLAKRIGYSQPFISMLENGKKGIPKPGTLKKLANGLGVPYIILMKKAGYVNKGGAFPAYTLAEASSSDSRKEEQKKLKEIERIEREVVTYNLFSILTKNADVYFKGHLLNRNMKESLVDSLEHSIEGLEKEDHEINKKEGD